ncbi:DeoR/GlpR transcriptional regulator [Aquibium carbonis]|uniref:DeoR/GlpR transcriptional regulator n=1 Tax=Aquibium carbonis TaxID=2495581 RepID=A0A429YQZ0_9HYPH|nr:DeoR/GlpR transcriptional regulator [Aquibium carbonis]
MMVDTMAAVRSSRARRRSDTRRGWRSREASWAWTFCNIVLLLRFWPGRRMTTVTKPPRGGPTVACRVLGDQPSARAFVPLARHLRAVVSSRRCPSLALAGRANVPIDPRPVGLRGANDRFRAYSDRCHSGFILPCEQGPVPARTESGPLAELLDRATHALAPQRQARLLEQLGRQTYVEVQDLCAALGVSEATIRRDLTELEARGLLKRTHGGALSIQQVARDYSNADRKVLRNEEKARIAAATAELVVDGDAVFIDSGTTTVQVARQLCQRDTLTFVTNGLDVFACLAAARASRLYMIGGEYVEVNHGFGGPLAADAIRQFSVDKAILSVSAVDLARGQVSIAAPAMVPAQRAMIEIAQTVIVVADHSKFERGALAVIAALDAIDYVVTNTATRALLDDMPAALRGKMIFA